MDWATKTGSGNTDVLKTAVETSDGKFLVSGDVGDDTEDFGWVGQNLIGHHGNDDGVAILYNAQGAELEKKCFGGWNHDQFNDVIETQDGHFLFVGETLSDLSLIHI